MSRSPDPDSANSRMSAHMGGWALGSGRPGDEDGYEHDEDEDEEEDEEDEDEVNLDWDSAQVRPLFRPASLGGRVLTPRNLSLSQAVVERMVGMKSDAPLPPPPPAHIQQGQQSRMQAHPPPPASQQPSQPEMRRRQTWRARRMWAAASFRRHLEADVEVGSLVRIKLLYLYGRCYRTCTCRFAQAGRNALFQRSDRGPGARPSGGRSSR